MHPLLRSRWIFISITAPQLILVFLYYSAYRVIGSLLDEETLRYWTIIGSWLGSMMVLSTIYAVIAWIKKIPLHWTALAAMLLGYLLLYAYIAFHIDDILSWSVPRWMIFEGDLQLYAFTFITPALVYTLIALVVWLTPPAKQKRAWLDFVIAVSIPVAWYLAINIIVLSRSHFHEYNAFTEHMIVIALASGTVLFLFFLIRGTYIIVCNQSSKLRKFKLAWKIPVAIVLPLIGLAINNGWFNHTYSYHEGVFGDFHSPWFVILSILNGIAVCLPESGNPQLRMGSFILRCITYPFTLYFFLVFLPWLPLSVIAIVAIGAGFLMLTPLVLMVIHTQDLASDRKFLKLAFPRSRLWLVMTLSFLVIPACIIITYSNDRKNLHAALDHLYAPDLNEGPASIDLNSIERTLNTLRFNRDTRNGFTSGTQGAPYLTTFYRWLVLDNLTLSAQKLKALENIFGVERESFDWRDNWRTLPQEEPLVKIDNIKTTSNYDEQEQAWRTQVDLTITNHSERSLQEYSTQLKLPDGCWISDYYLVVEGKKKKGLLAEKQAAMWVYQQIVSTNRDPGILYYQGSNRIAFKVFPLASKETRYTGIEFLHKEPLTMSIDSFRIALGDSMRKPNKPVIVEAGTAKAIYVPSSVKATLPKVTRRPYYHFVFDASAAAKYRREELMSRISYFIKQNAVGNSQDEISFVNYNVRTVPLAEGENTLKSVEAEGGFFAELAIRKELYDNYSKSSNSYPVFIVVTSDKRKAVFTGAIRDMLFAYPEGENFYYLDSLATLQTCSFYEPQQVIDSLVTAIASPNTCVHYNANGTSAYLPDNGEGSLIVPLTNDLDVEELTTRSWASGAKMQMMIQHNALHPGQAEDDFLDLVKNSFRTGIMNPHTSYIVLENEAQEKAMLEKQKQILSAKRGLDAGSDIHQMSEPSLWILLIATGGAIWLLRRRSASRKAA